MLGKVHRHAATSGSLIFVSRVAAVSGVHLLHKVEDFPGPASSLDAYVPLLGDFSAAMAFS